MCATLIETTKNTYIFKTKFLPRSLFFIQIGFPEQHATYVGCYPPFIIIRQSWARLTHLNDDKTIFFLYIDWLKEQYFVLNWRD